MNMYVAVLDHFSNAWPPGIDITTLRPRHLYVNEQRAARTTIPGGGRCANTSDNPKAVLPPGPSPCTRPLGLWDTADAPSNWLWLAYSSSARSHQRIDGEGQGMDPLVLLTRKHPRAAHLNATGFLLPLGDASSDAIMTWSAKSERPFMRRSSELHSCGAPGVEFIFTGVGGSPWAETRCPVVSVRAWQPMTAEEAKLAGVELEPKDGAAQRAYVQLAQDCWERYKWKNLVQKKKSFIAPPTAIENVGYGTLQPGEWWADTCGAMRAPRIFYHAFPGQPLPRFELPILDQLVVGRGAQNVHFSGISFRHSTWTRPLGSEGWVEDQSGVACKCAAWTDYGQQPSVEDSVNISKLLGAGLSVDEAVEKAGAAMKELNEMFKIDGARRARSIPNPLVGSFGAHLDCDEVAAVMPAAVSLTRAHRVTFERCEFAGLGANGLSLIDGTHASGASECRFRDISGSAFVVGSFDGGHRVKDWAVQAWNNYLRQSVIEKAAVEFHGGVGVAVGFAANTTISHNLVRDLAYAAISVGWGWGLLSFASSNLIIGNRITRYKQMLNDGGCIYTLSPQPWTIVEGNWCHRQGTPSSGALYPDEGSAGMTWRSNVVSDVGGSSWLHVWNESIRDLTIEGNFHTTERLKMRGTNITMRGNVFVADASKLPPRAMDIARASGPSLRSPWTDVVGANELLAELTRRRT